MARELLDKSADLRFCQRQRPLGIIDVNAQVLGGRRLRQAGYFRALAIDPFADFSKDVDALKALQDVPFFNALARRAITRVSGHIADLTLGMKRPETVSALIAFS